MEKLLVEIELSREELEMLNSLIEHGCIDLKMYLERQIKKAIVRHNLFINYEKAEMSQKAG